MCERTTKEKQMISEELHKTFWRLHVYKILRRNVLIDKIDVHEQSLDLQTTLWEEYWKDTPTVFKKKVSELHKTWTIYIDNYFHPRYAHGYSDQYLSLISDVVKQYPSSTFFQRRFLVKLLGFENIILTFSGIKNAFAAMTTSFRNPLFLSFKKRKYRKNNKNDPCLLPLITAVNDDNPIVFYHYRKQRLLKNTDDNMLFFPAVDLNIRENSFHGLEKLTKKFVLPWDSRIEQRSNLITNKVLFPILKSLYKKKKESLRILDIGSGDGQFTSIIIKKILKSGLLKNNKIELTLLDLLMIDPSKRFSNNNLLAGLAKVEYISNDYAEWINKQTTRQCDRYDIVFLFRILHNVSRFKISAESVTPDCDVLSRGRYKVYPYLSDYYRCLSLLFPEMVEDRTEDGDMLYYPSRIFHESSLMTFENNSIIELLCSISKGILIEDGDLTREILLDHLSRYSCKMLNVFDLSHHLRLSINHIYWITHEINIPVGEKIWPK